MFDNFGDDYTVIVSKRGYAEASFRPVKVAASVIRTVDLVLVPENCHYKFPE